MSINTDGATVLREQAIREWKEASGYDDLLAAHGRAAAEAARLQKLFDDAGEGQYNVLALIDYYQGCVHDEADTARGLADRIEGALAALKRIPCDGGCPVCELERAVLILEGRLP